VIRSGKSDSGKPNLFLTKRPVQQLAAKRILTLGRSAKFNPCLFDFYPRPKRQARAAIFDTVKPRYRFNGNWATPSFDGRYLPDQAYG